MTRKKGRVKIADIQQGRTATEELLWNSQQRNYWGLKLILLDRNISLKRTGPDIINFMLNSAEHVICPANKSQITNDFKSFLAKHC